MAAPKGNDFYLKRSKHGRSKIFKTADIMWKAALEYFKDVAKNPLEKVIIYQGEISSKPEPLMRAMTIKGLCIYWGVNSKYLAQFESELNLETGEGKDFSNVISTIKETIETQKFEGASAGLLNPNIIARDLGLTDKKELNGDLLNPLTEVIKEIAGNTLGPSISD